MKIVSSNWFPHGQTGPQFGRRHFHIIFLHENDKIPIRISLKIVLKSPIDNKPELVQVMAWLWTGEMPLPEPMMTKVYWRIYAALGGDELSLEQMHHKFNQRLPMTRGDLLNSASHW